MAVIERVEILMVDLKPEVVRSDAIQFFTSQETPIVRITDSGLTAAFGTDNAGFDLDAVAVVHGD